MKTEIIDDIIKWQLNKTIKYHPILQENFSDSELKLIFGYSKNINDHKEEVAEIKRFCQERKFTSLKDIIEVVKVMFPSFINGMYDAKYNIEVSTDLIHDQLLIEHNGKILTPKELVRIYKN